MGIDGRNTIMEEIVDKDLSEAEAINLIVEKFVEPNNKLFQIPGERKGFTETILPYSDREKEQAFISLGKRLYDSLAMETP